MKPVDVPFQALHGFCILFQPESRNLHQGKPRSKILKIVSPVKTKIGLNIVFFRKMKE